MTGALQYPREWFGVSRWETEPVARTFDRETETRLYYRERGRDRFEAKAGRCHRWYQTKDEAQSHIDAREKDKADRKAADRVRDAATYMLETLHRLAALTPSVANAGTADDLHLTVKAIAESAIERACPTHLPSGSIER